MLMGAGLFLRTLMNLRSVNLGFVPERLMILDVNPRAAGYEIDQAAAVTHRVLERLRAVPGIPAASFSENGVMFGRDSSTNLIRPEGFVAGAEGFPRAQWDIVGPGYFSTMGIPLVAGRDFTDRDDAASPNVMAINEAMALRFFPGANPIGRRVIWGDEKVTDFEVIGVVRDIKHTGPRDEPHLRFYLPYYQLSNTRPSWDLASVRFLVRAPADPAAMLPVLHRAIAAEDARLSVSNAYIATELIDRALVQERMIAKLSFAFGVLAAGLACIGLYGLIGYHVVQRTNEIGIRMALGAQRAEVLWSTLRRALVWMAAGIAAGIPLALAASRTAENLLFGLNPMDVVTLSAAAALMLLLGALAAFIPARRASRVDPLVALRYE
jgi:predicted permease